MTVFHLPETLGPYVVFRKIQLYMQNQEHADTKKPTHRLRLQRMAPKWWQVELLQGKEVNYEPLPALLKTIVRSRPQSTCILTTPAHTHTHTYTHTPVAGHMAAGQIVSGPYSACTVFPSAHI